MITITGGHNQWWEATINRLSDPYTTSEFNYKFNHLTVEKMSFQEAADYTANHIASHYNNLYVAMSGGLDSSFIAEVLYRNNIPFTPIIGYLNTANTSSTYDYFHAMFWCEQRNIKPVVIEYSIDDPRLIKQYVKMIKKIKATSLGSVMLVDLIDYVNDQNGHILVGDPMLPYLTEGSNYYNPIGPVFDTHWYAISTELLDPTHTHPGGFFFYTPELLLALVTEIDLNSNESVAKTKLFNIPYRPKTYPNFDCISQTMLDKINYFYKLDQYVDIPAKCWTKEELIKELSKQ